MEVNGTDTREQGTSRKNTTQWNSNQKYFKTFNRTSRAILSANTNPQNFHEVSSGNSSESESNGCNIILQKRDHWEDGSIIKSCQEGGTSQEGSGFKRLHTGRQLFEFWELKEPKRTNGNASRSASQYLSCSDRVQTCRLITRSNNEVSMDHVRGKDLHSQVSDIELDKENHNYAKAITTQRRRKRDLTSDPMTFSQIDEHVLRVSQQIKSCSRLSAQKIVYQILGRVQNELEKVRAICIWLCNNIEYDISGYLGLSEKMYTPQQVLESRRAVCSGYSSLFKEMCREAGITCTEVSGHGKGIGYRFGHNYQHKKSSHMWNAVKVDNHWYLLDACWAAGTVDVERQVFVQRYDDYYFLPDPEEFIDSHWPDDPKWQLMDPVISLEDFEQRVFKTSAFYRFGLSLIFPKVFLLQTVNGEAAVRLGAACAVEFSYRISRLGEGLSRNIDTSCGIMRVTPNGMELRIIPPTEGEYDLKIFTKPLNSKERYTWVCSYQVNCSEPKTHHRLPANPFIYWGLHWTAKSIGIDSSNCSEGFINASDGHAQLHFQTSRPLAAMYELTHEELDSNVSKRCIVSQIGEGKLNCSIVLLAKGYYRLSAFVKQYNQEGPYQNFCNCLIYCSNPVNQNEIFPANLSNHCGPGARTKEVGFLRASHPEPVINTNRGECNITFHTTKDFEVTATLTKDGGSTEDFPLERQTLCTQIQNKVSIEVSLPAAGAYKLRIFVRSEEEEDFGHVCDYVIRSSAHSQQPPFPLVYSMWRKGCVLIEPRSGLLPSENWVKFQVRIPGAHRVLLIGESRTQLQLSSSQVWEGNMFTGQSGSQLKLAAIFDRMSSLVSVVALFNVGDHFIQKL